MDKDSNYQSTVGNEILKQLIMIHASLFSGIGGFDLAAEWVGWENAFHCEINPFGQQVLKYYYPNAISYDDITKTDFTIWRGRIDVLSGGFPCQPYSLAGKRLGKEDDRHLWPEMLRAIREIQPEWVVGENVFGLINWDGGVVFDEVQADLEAQGYEVQAYVLPAVSVNAPHRRDRVWFVAFKDTNKDGWRSEFREEKPNFGQFRDISAGDNEWVCPNDEQTWIIANAKSDGGNRTSVETSCKIEGQDRHNFKQFTERGKIRNATNPRRGQWQNGLHGQEQGWQTTEFGNGYTQFGAWSEFPVTEPTICGGNDGLSRKLDRITFPKWRNESIKAYGNAIVPQVALQIFKAINEYNLLI